MTSNETVFYQWGLPIAGTGIVLLIWEILAGTLNLVSSQLLPSPLEIFSEFMEFRDLIMLNIQPTIVASIIGFIAAVVLGILFGVILSLNEKVEDILMPFLLAGNVVPRVALTPLIIFYVGGFDAKYLISAWLAFFPVLVSVHDGLHSVSDDIEDLLEVLGATTYQKLVWVRLPSSLSFIFDGMKLAVILSLVGAVVGEFVASDQGLGFLSLYALRSFNTALVLATVAVTGLLSVSAFFLLFVLQNQLVHWKETNLFAGQ